MTDRYDLSGRIVISNDVCWPAAKHVQGLLRVAQEELGTQVRREKLGIDRIGDVEGLHTTELANLRVGQIGAIPQEGDSGGGNSTRILRARQCRWIECRKGSLVS